MNTLELPIFSLLALFLAATVRADAPEAPAKVVLAIHGGAGPVPKKKMTLEHQPRQLIGPPDDLNLAPEFRPENFDLLPETFSFSDGNCQAEVWYF